MRCKKDGQQRYEAQQMEAAKRHEQLMKLFSTQSSMGKTPTHSTSPLKESKLTYEYLPNNSFRATFSEDRGKGILPKPQLGHEGIFGKQGQRNSYYVPHPNHL